MRCILIRFPIYPFLESTLLTCTRLPCLPYNPQCRCPIRSAEEKEEKKAGGIKEVCQRAYHWCPLGIQNKQLPSVITGRAKKRAEPTAVLDGEKEVHLHYRLEKIVDMLRWQHKVLD